MLFFNVINYRTHRVLRSTWPIFQCLSFILLVIVDWENVLAFLEKYASGISGLFYSYNGLLDNVFSFICYCEPQPTSFLNIFNLYEGIPPCMEENVLNSVGLIVVLFSYYFCFMSWPRDHRVKYIKKLGRCICILSFCTLKFWNL